MVVSNIMVQTKSRHHRHEDFNLVFTNHGKEDIIYPLRTKKILLKRDSNTAQTKIIDKIYCKKCKNTRKEFAFETY
jgi:hypothetical protein